jgi:hypothetical protein
VVTYASELRVPVTGSRANHPHRTILGANPALTPGDLLRVMRSRVAKLAADLHADMFIRLEERDMAAFDAERLLALVEREERLVKESR